VKPIRYDRKFRKHFKNRIEGKLALERRLADRVNLFCVNRQDTALKDHALTGTKNGLRAFSITGDIRIVYVELEDRYEFLDIGSHNQVY
jgi:addiction module RelE/StbE family toxin